MNKLITICARGGSKGIPGKNIKLLNGKPLIYYSLKFAEEYANRYDNTWIYLSTDSEEIKRVVKELGFRNIFTDYLRPPELATDAAGKIPAIKDVKEYAEKTNHLKFDYIIDLDATSPLRTMEDIDLSLNRLSNHKGALNIFSVSPAHRNPYFNMVEEKDDGFVKLCKEGKFLSRQSAPRVFDMNASFYIYTPEFFQNGLTTSTTNRSLHFEVPHLCFDLDEPVDFEFMEYLLSNNKLNFEFIK